MSFLASEFQKMSKNCQCYFSVFGEIKQFIYNLFISLLNGVEHKFVKKSYLKSNPKENF